MYNIYYRFSIRKVYIIYRFPASILYIKTCEYTITEKGSEYNTVEHQSWRVINEKKGANTTQHLINDLSMSPSSLLSFLLYIQQMKVQHESLYIYISNTASLPSYVILLYCIPFIPNFYYQYRLQKLKIFISISCCCINITVTYRGHCMFTYYVTYTLRSR